MKGIKMFCLLGMICTANVVFGTAQLPDILIYKGKEMALLDFPIAQYPDRCRLTKILLFGRYYNRLQTTACWRGKVMTWEFDHDSLFLVRIENIAYKTPEERVKYGYRETEADSFGCQYADL